MDNSDDTVECGTHGTSAATYVCNHLVDGERRGFNYGYSTEDPDRHHPDAWCDECEKILDAEGEWNEKSESLVDIKVLCASCYENLRERNWIENEDEFHDFVCEGSRYLESKQSVFLEKFRINDHERWDWDQETGKLIFSHEGVAMVEAEISFSGSVSTKSNTWLWAWANDSCLESVKSASREVREIGESMRYLKLASARWSASEKDGWEMTAIMAKAVNAIGAYRTVSDSGFSYMVIKKAKWLGRNRFKNIFPKKILNVM